jgi:hypothetical protein
MRRQSKSSRSLRDKIATCSSLVLGAGVGLGAAESSDAAVVPFVPPGGPITVYPYLSGPPWFADFDINGDGIDDFYIYDYSYFGYFGLGGADYLTQTETNLVMGEGYLATNVAPGATVGPNTTTWDFSSSLDNFLGTRGYAGVVFDIPGGSPHFGYLDISVAADRSSATLYGGAYESQANTPITTPVPEPSSLALLAGGAASLAVWRRRRET